MIWSALLILLAFVAVCFVILGALGVWMRDEHPPIWLPPEPRHVNELPLVYDWEKQDAEWLAKFLEEHTDDARRPPD